MPEDAHISTHAKVAALQIVTLLKLRYRLPEIDADDLRRITGYIDTAIIDAGNLERIKRAAAQPDDGRERE